MLSIVIPVYNEADSLQPLHAELDETARTAGLQLDVIFVDDGSTDGSWDVIRRIAAVEIACTSRSFPPAKVPISYSAEGKRMASGLTRNQMPRKGLRVRIPCPPLCCALAASTY